MKRALLLEFILGGGLQSHPESEIPVSFRTEGWAMMSAVAKDWRDPSIDRRRPSNPFNLIVPLDPRAMRWFPETTSDQIFLPLDPKQDYLQQWSSLAKDVDAVIVIAPECDHILEEVVKEIDRVTSRRIGCRNPFLQRSCNKLEMAEWLRLPKPNCGLDRIALLHPLTISAECFLESSSSLQNASDLWVIKPVDGAGCEGIYRGTFAGIRDWLVKIETRDRLLVQAWREGQAGSVAVWVSNDDRYWMPPVQQTIQWIASNSYPHLEKPQYHGGEGPLPEKFWDQVHQFGDLVLDRLGEGAGGWIGIDFVYVVDDGQLELTAIEVNPRWTTSYVGIRHLYRGNLLLDMLALDHGALDLSDTGRRECWRPHQVSWQASGRVESGD